MFQTKYILLKREIITFKQLNKMRDLDIEFGFDGENNFEPFDNVKDETISLNKEDNSKNKKSKEIKKDSTKSWTDTLSNLTKKYKDLSGFKTNEQLIAEKEQERLEKGTKYKILGMNPFVAISLSFFVIIAGSVVITKLKVN
jgi:hypothetical protein